MSVLQPDGVPITISTASTNLQATSNNSALVTKQKKSPFHDTSEAFQTKPLVILSFWLVVILLGLPLWWRTTAIYRADLPLKEMQSWADGRACRAEFPLLVDVQAPSLPDPEHLLKTVQHALDDANDFSAHHIRLRLSPNTSEGSHGVSDNSAKETIAAMLRLIPGPPGSTHSYSLSPSSRVIDLFYSPSYNPSSSASSTSLSAFVASTLQDIFAEEQQMISYLLSSSSTPTPSPSPSSGNSNGNNGASKVNTAEIARKMSRIVRYSPTYHLTFSLFTATGTPSSWEVREAIEEYLQPLLEALGGISTFTVDSQIQFYASLSSSVVPTWVPDSGSARDNQDDKEQDAQSQEKTEPGKWILKKEDLSSFINSAEWPLVSITSYPTINFIIYIPSKEQTPLVIPDSATNAFLLPQWGGVMVLNLNTTENGDRPVHLTKEALKPSLDIFATQLLALLGTPTNPASLPIRLDSLTRQRSAELLVSASSTLGSLYRLTLALPSISIPSSVSASVASTISSLENSCRELKKGHFGGEGGALEAGRNAAAEAERAFFEKSMVGQVYFPEEHKVAVYLPLMGPVGVPLVTTAAKEIKRFILQWKAGRLAARGPR
ncbi:GPI transamidase component [Rhizina undulata]